MVGKVVHTSAGELARYHDQHLSNGDYHSEEGKVQGEFIGALAEEWGTEDATDSQGGCKIPGILRIGYKPFKWARASATKKVRALRHRVRILGSKIGEYRCRSRSAYRQRTDGGG